MVLGVARTVGSHGKIYLATIVPLACAINRLKSYGPRMPSANMLCPSQRIALSLQTAIYWAVES